MKNIVGPPVEGENFFGRMSEIKYAWQKIKDGNNLILPSPRRVGKTSFAKKLIDHAKRNDWKVLEFNFEGLRTEEEFVKLFIYELENQNLWTISKKEVQKLFCSIKGFKYTGDNFEFTGDFDHYKKDIYQKLSELINHNAPTLILIDEFTVLLRAISNSKEHEHLIYFLNFLRVLRQKSSKIRWIYSSSISIQNFAFIHGVSQTVNDFLPIELTPFPDDVASDLLKKLASSHGIYLSQNNIEFMIRKIGWNMPYYLQAYFEQVNHAFVIERATINERKLEDAYKNLVQSNKFDTWVDRLKEYDELEKPASYVLKILSKDHAGLTRDAMNNALISRINKDIEEVEEIVGKLVKLLSQEGYLERSEDRYFFRSPLLRDFWNNYAN